MAKILVIGGGVIGTMHAWYALRAGHEVVQLERDAQPRGASVRNFGLVWVGGRASGAELSVALRARELWGEIAREFDQLKFRPNGSLTIANNLIELTVLEQAMAKTDAGQRQWKLVEPDEARALNPALRGEFLGALWCPLDATVEPGSVLASLRSGLSRSENYLVHFDQDVLEIVETADGVLAKTRCGESFEGDLVIVCPGADHSSLFAEEFSQAPIRRVRLQMMSTAPYDETITTSIADGDSLRYYPAYDVPALEELGPQHPVAAAHKMQLLLVQRTDGTLTIGDTHEYEEPFDFKLGESPYQYLAAVAEGILGRQLPPIVRRWDGIYSQRTDGEICDRRWITPRIVSVTGPGGRGNTLSPAIAESTFREVKP